MQLVVQGVPKMTQLVFATTSWKTNKFDNFWHIDSQDDKIM